ncbi:MAG: site-specific integrase [Vicinamibacterales bacterium]
MARPSAEASRDRVLTADEIRAVWTWLDRDPQTVNADGDPRLIELQQIALKLRFITAQRGGEVLALRWTDVDLVDGWWTIPAEVSKNKLPHRVPLSAMAIDLLGKLLQAAPKKAVHVFGGIRGTRHRRGALEGLDVADIRPHDFRRTAASLMTAGGIPRLTVAKILNHVDCSVTAVYDRHGYDAEKRQALDWWGMKLAATIDGTSGRLLPFTAEGAWLRG